METTRKKGKSLVIGVVLVVLLATAGLVFAASNQAQEEGALWQLWDLTPANLDTGTAERAQDGELNTEEQPENLFLWEKENFDCNVYDPCWTIVEDGAWGRLVYFSENNPNNEFAFSGYGLDTGKDYTLINYGSYRTDGGIKCMGSGTTDSDGYVNIKGEMPYPLLIDYGDPQNMPDPIGAKIWLVLSSDVDGDSENSEMIGWHPTEYLFENNLINPEDNGQNNLLENAVEVSPGVFYLGNHKILMENL